MRELPVGRREVVDEEGRTHTYEYAVLIGESPFSSQMACESYGACVRDAEGQCSQVPNITLSAARIEELMELLLRNTVAPCTLLDVVEDWL